MLPHFLGFLALLGATLLVLLGLGICAFALARGDHRLAARTLAATAGVGLLYLLATTLFVLSAPRRVLPVGQEIAFCGFDCHLHVSVVASESGRDRIGVIVRVRSDAKEAPEYPGYLQFRLVGSDAAVVAPDNETRVFRRPLESGESYVDSLYFTVPTDGNRYSLRVIYPGPIDALLLGPANSRGRGKTTLGLGDSPS